MLLVIYVFPFVGCITSMRPTIATGFYIKLLLIRYANVMNKF